QRRALTSPPTGEARISVATLTELRVGVLRADNEPLRQLREATFQRASRFLALAYDEAVGEHVAQLLATARAKQRKAGAMDVIIAATALAHDLVIWTQDSDFGVLQDLAPALSVHTG
ncbi:MAG: PIN domain-containing protein, partial [Mycobacteriales bacterium]